MKRTLGIFRSTLLLAALFMAGTIIQSSAVTIGFEGTGVDPSGVISPVPLPYTESGFVISNGSPAAESGIFGANTGGEANSGSDFFGLNFGGTIILAQVSGDAFTLNTFDAGHIGEIGSLPAVLTLQVTGNLDGGGTVMASFSYTNPWDTFVLPGTFTGLSSVEFSTTLDGDVGLDNIVINASSVPDAGSTLMLLSMVTVALTGFRARRK